MTYSVSTKTKITDVQSCEQSCDNLDDKFNNTKKCIYEQARPEEPKYLAPLREWEKKMGFVTPIIWTNAIPITVFHVITVAAVVYSIIHGSAPKWQTVVFVYIMGQVAGFGVTAGVHRYWTHRSYKATFWLRMILLICYSAAGQNNIYDWVRDHRVHHKFSETSADPHDARRGFFFSHVGWLMKKHPDVIREGNKIDMSDIANDYLVQFHKKYFNIFRMIFCFLLPTVIPVYAWGDNWTNAVLSQPLFRYMLTLNCTWSVNSFAHIWGNRPYDRNISPAENWGVSVMTMGEGWHNYHYKAKTTKHQNSLTLIIAPHHI